jgi:hypothetical protein
MTGFLGICHRNGPFSDTPPLQRLLGFSQQAGVLDRDDRLVGKGAHQFDLPFGEWLDALARLCEDADRLALAHSGTPSAVRALPS